MQPPVNAGVLCRSYSNGPRLIRNMPALHLRAIDVDRRDFHRALKRRGAGDFALFGEMWLFRDKRNAGSPIDSSHP